MKSKKRIVIVIVIVFIIAILAVGGVFLWNYINELKENDNSGLKVDSNVLLDEESEKEYTEERVSTINVNILKELTLKKKEDGTGTMRLKLHNGNKSQYMFTITVDNQEIYRSDLIPADASLEEITLPNVTLEPGGYEAVIIFTVVSEKDNQTALGSTGVAIPMTVK